MSTSFFTPPVLPQCGQWKENLSMHNRSSIVAYVNQFLQLEHVRCHIISLTAVNIVKVFIKGRRESVSNEQCKVQSDCKSQAIYKQQSAESLLIPNQQSANLLKLEHTGTHRFQYLYVMQYPFCKKCKMYYWLPILVSLPLLGDLLRRA